MQHIGILDDENRHHWETKRAWYNKFFPGRLVTTQETGTLSKDAEALIEKHFS
jgi:exodeoxyribonuclease V alpha subunit